MPEIKINVINKSDNELPTYASAGASGMDIRAFLPDALTLAPMQRTLIPTGLYMEIPEGYEAQVRPRSGLAIKQGITCLNTPGTIDSDYRGEIKIVLVNLSSEEQVVHPGDRIAQMVIQKVERAVLSSIVELTVTSRNQGGFGSTGKH